MTSAQEDGQVEIRAVRRDGMEKTVAKGHVSVFAPGGGAGDGALSSTTAINARHSIPESGPMLRPDDKIIVQFTPTAADGLDASDCVWAIPVTEYGADGRRIGVKHLARSDFANPTFADITLTANIPQVLAGYQVTEAGLRIGGSHIFLDVQDDT